MSDAGLWLDRALAAEPLAAAAPPLAGEQSAEVAIVGGGFTGLWTALHVKALAPEADVVLIERDVCGWGASGRNAGYLLDWWAKLASFETQCGVEGARWLADAAAEAREQVAGFCASHAPDAGCERAGWLWGATTPAQVGAWSSVLALHERRGVEVLRPVGREEAVALGGSPSLLEGVLHERAGVLDPAALGRALRRVALERGLRLHERTPLLRLERGVPARLVTPGGALRAERVVLATNAWLVRFPEPARSLFGVGSDVAVTDPAPQRIEAAGWRARTGMTDARMMLHYARALPDGRLLLGLGGSSLAGPGTRGLAPGPLSARRVARLERARDRLLPAFAGVPFASAWGGIVDRSWSGLPLIGRLDGRPDLIWGAGYSGNGVGPSWLVARMLAALALGRDDDHARAAALLPPTGGLPREPLRTLGGRLVHAAVRRAEALDDDGRSADPLTLRLAALAPTGVVPRPAA